jgi:pimeloyl-ACP methyl ester carboxylesterase
MTLPPLLCVPGTLCDARLFAPLLARLDWPAWSTRPISEPDLAESARRLADGAPDRFVALGFSLGGFVALEWLRQMPDRLAGLVLIGSNARPDPAANAAGRRAQVAQAKRDGRAAVVEGLWGDYLAPENEGDAALRGAIRTMAEDCSDADFAAQAEIAITRPASLETVAKTALPILLVRGEADRLCPADRVSEIAAAARHADCATIAGAGHFAPLEAPGEVADALAEWLIRTVR